MSASAVFSMRLGVVAIISLGAIGLLRCAASPAAPAGTVVRTSTAAVGTPTPTSAGLEPVASSNPVPTSTQTTAPSPTATRWEMATSVSSSPTATPITASVRVYDSSVSFSAYPYGQFLKEQKDVEHNMTFTALDRGRYDQAAIAQEVTPRTVHAVVLENEFLRLTFLPELGGRLFQITYKPTNQNLLYNNRVLKPTNWGPADQGGWLAVGGMEWAFPVNEHGYEWGTPWEYHIELHSDGVSLTLSDTTAKDRAQVSVIVFLPNDAAFIWIHPEIVNPTAALVRLQFWINAQLTLGASKNVSPGTEFILPADSVFVHSTGDQFIPQPNVPQDGASSPSAPVAWSHIGGHDLSGYSSWEDYLGVFAADITRPFVGAYDHDTDLGIVRVFPPQQAPGVKLFAFGPKFCCRSQFSDDGSDYFELWGGLPRTFFPSDDVTLAPGETRMWDEYWVPFAKTGGLSAATRDAVLYLSSQGGTATVSAYSAVLRSAQLVLSEDGAEIKRWSVRLVPGTTFTATSPAGSGKLQLRMLATDGSTIVETQ